MLQLILLAVLFAAFFYYFGIKPMRYWEDKGVRHGKPVWILGDSWKTVLRMESFTDMVQRVYNQVPGVRYSGMYQFTSPTLIIRDPELIKHICVRDFDHFVDHKSFASEITDPLWARNMFALKGQKWRDMRSIVSPCFTSSKMKAMFVLMSECAENFCSFFLNKNQDVIEVEMKDIFTRFTNDVIATTAFGISTDSLEHPNNEFYMMGKNASDFSSWRKNLKMFGMIFMPQLCDKLNISFFDKTVTSFFIELVANTIKTRQEKGIIRIDMIHLLVETQKELQQEKENRMKSNDEDHTEKKALKSLTDMDIAAQAMVFLFGGFDSVSSVMCFMAYELGANPDIQQKLRDEINETLEECNGSLNYDALHKMKYMDMVLSETLRKWPTGTIMERICTKPYTIQPTSPEEKPVHLNTGDAVWIPVFGIHRDPKIYPDPERFDPERFNEENKGNFNQYAYIPFGLGPRICIGNRLALLETKVIMFHLLSNFEIVPTSKTRIPLKITRKQLNLLPDGGFWFGLKRLRT